MTATNDLHMLTKIARALCVIVDRDDRESWLVEINPYHVPGGGRPLTRKMKTREEAELWRAHLITGMVEAAT